MRTSAGLLASATSLTNLEQVLRAAGLCGETTELDALTREALGLEDVTHTLIGAGPGSVRALVLALPHDSLREALHRATRKLASRAPHVLWFVAGVDAAGACAGVV